MWAAGGSTIDWIVFFRICIFPRRPGAWVEPIVFAAAIVVDVGKRSSNLSVATTPVTAVIVLGPRARFVTGGSHRRPHMMSKAAGMSGASCVGTALSGQRSLSIWSSADSSQHGEASGCRIECR